MLRNPPREASALGADRARQMANVRAVVVRQLRLFLLVGKENNGWGLALHLKHGGIHQPDVVIVTDLCG